MMPRTARYESWKPGEVISSGDMAIWMISAALRMPSGLVSRPIIRPVSRSVMKRKARFREGEGRAEKV